jgi:hypothetical protein
MIPVGTPKRFHSENSDLLFRQSRHDELSEAAEVASIRFDPPRWLGYAKSPKCQLAKDHKNVLTSAKEG